MIGKFKKWIEGIVRSEMEGSKVVPSVVSHGSLPIVQVYKITNGYIFSKSHGTPYRDEHPAVIYCATPLDVARQIINGEALQKMGIQPDQMQTTGYASGKLGTQTNPVPTL